VVPSPLPSAPKSQAKLALEGIHCAFRDGTGRPLPVLDGIELNVAANEFVAIVGPSGAGKSTLFNVLAGLVLPTSGRVVLDGADITGSTGLVAYMMQKDLLLSWRSVLDNVVLGPEIDGRPMDVARERARALMSEFGLGGFEDFYPAALSGGMRQRAALMRTILCEKSVLLLDEPLGALDAITRASMHEWMLNVFHEHQRTVLFITHDPEEAVFLSDRVFVLTGRPARVKDIVEVGLARPRRHDVIGTLEFAQLKRRVLDLVWEEDSRTR
jgi:ABC-type nitrate/sulfonate/bicarbonate transport system ATPase subunit